MPYIKPEDRPAMDVIVDVLQLTNARPNGRLLYVLFNFCKRCIHPSYGSYKSFIGELNEAAAEICRRHPYYHEYIGTRKKRSLSQESITLLDKVVEVMQTTKVEPDGKLNYILYKLYIHNRYKGYITELNDCVDTIRRELLGPYEDQKIIQNGDVL